MKIRNLNKILVLIVFLLNACSTYELHPDLKSGIYPVSSIGVVPLEIGVLKVGFGMKMEPMPEKNVAVDKGIARGFANVLAANRMKATVLTEEAVPETDLKDIRFYLNLCFNKASVDVNEEYKDEFRYRCSVTALSEYGKKYGVDSFLVYSFSAAEKTEGEYAMAMTKSILMAVVTYGASLHIPDHSTIQGKIILVDAESGEVLFFNKTKDEQSFDVNKAGESAVFTSNIISPLIKALPGVAS